VQNFARSLLYTRRTSRNKIVFQGEVIIYSYVFPAIKSYAMKRGSLGAGYMRIGRMSSESGLKEKVAEG